MGQSNDEKCKVVPLIVLNEMIIMPGTNVHFDLQKKSSVYAVNQAMESGQEVFVVSAKTGHLTEPVTFDQVNTIGTLVRVKQVLKLPKSGVRVLFSGVKRMRLSYIVNDDKYNLAAVWNVSDESNLTRNEESAYVRSVKSVLQVCHRNKMLSNPATYDVLKKVKDLELLVDLAVESVSLTWEQKQKILETLDLRERVEVLLSILLNEVDVNKIREEIADRLKECVNKNQREYVLREQLRVIHEELGEQNTDIEGSQYDERLAEVAPPAEVYEKLQKEINRFKTLQYSSSESGVLRNYIETLLDYPWNVSSDEEVDFNQAIEQLEKDHYGLTKIKERIIDYLAVLQLSGKKDAAILCLVGPPGTGKTSIAKSVASALKREYGRIALGGVKDEAEIRGHRKTYIGAMPGRIVSTISGTGVNNPVILLDEIDKTGNDYRGDTASALLEVLDGEQNVRFVDHFFEVPVDLSKVLFIATANDASDIPAPLRDRMELIEVNSYTENEKFHIAKLYLLKKQLKKNGLLARQFKITDEAIYKLIRNYTKEAGVRSLERLLGTLMQKAARGILTGQWKSLRVTEKKLAGLIGNEKYRDDSVNLEDKAGVVTGLAWTKVGGDTLNVEVNILDGKGELRLTGNLGDVMKESAQIALSYVRTLPAIKEFEKEFFENHIIHVHVPEGATPKDGPSAGITMALAIYSALVNRQVSGTVAMTGEITLKGKVLPIGGLKEKLLAAKTAGIKKVLVPKDNRKNVEELDAEILEGMEIVYVSDMEEVIEQAIVRRSFVLRPSATQELPAGFRV